jgi:hypothetical protein
MTVGHAATAEQGHSKSFQPRLSTPSQSSIRASGGAPAQTAPRVRQWSSRRAAIEVARQFTASDARSRSTPQRPPASPPASSRRSESHQRHSLATATQPSTTTKHPKQPTPSTAACNYAPAAVDCMTAELTDHDLKTILASQLQGRNVADTPGVHDSRQVHKDLLTAGDRTPSQVSRKPAQCRSPRTLPCPNSSTTDRNRQERGALPRRPLRPSRGGVAIVG